jgi:hypothetical protein
MRRHFRAARASMPARCLSLNARHETVRSLSGSSLSWRALGAALTLDFHRLAFAFGVKAPGRSTGPINWRELLSLQSRAPAPAPPPARVQGEMQARNVPGNDRKTRAAVRRRHSPQRMASRFTALHLAAARAAFQHCAVLSSSGQRTPSIAQATPSRRDSTLSPQTAHACG